ncbi:MAG: KpsF/GutQ family sugar-phosphate isomerase [Arachidicoccus sp.]|nr:KpsF/GutQ family sugar-phosphate isomerase [Arachidicoccus sp.]
MNTSILETARQTIFAEQQAIAGLARQLNHNFENVVNIIHHSKGRIIISGIGKSAIIAQKIAATFNSTGTPSFYLHAGEATHGDLGMIQKDDIIIILSKSGESSEIKTLVALVKGLGNIIVSITGYLDSYLANQSDFVINASVDKEACINNLAPTSSTTAQMVIGDAIAVCVMQLRNFSSDDFAKLHPGGNLGKRLYLKIEDIYHHNACPTVFTDADIKSIILEISKGRVGAVAVTSENNKLKGIITDGDIRRLLEKDVILSDKKALQILSPNPKTATPETLAITALETLKRFDLNQLIVIDKDESVLGFIHLHDLIREGIY